ncbi:hypothetical protein L345_14598, partial [Ophiophagus hannah]
MRLYQSLRTCKFPGVAGNTHPLFLAGADGNWGSTPGLTSESRNMSFSVRILRLSGSGQGSKSKHIVSEVCVSLSPFVCLLPLLSPPASQKPPAWAGRMLVGWVRLDDLQGPFQLCFNLPYAAPQKVPFISSLRLGGLQVYAERLRYFCRDLQIVPDLQRFNLAAEVTTAPKKRDLGLFFTLTAVFHTHDRRSIPVVKNSNAWRWSMGKLDSLNVRLTNLTTARRFT